MLESELESAQHALKPRVTYRYPRFFSGFSWDALRFCNIPVIAGVIGRSLLRFFDLVMAETTAIDVLLERHRLPSSETHPQPVSYSASLVNSFVPFPILLLLLLLLLLFFFSSSLFNHKPLDFRYLFVYFFSWNVKYCCDVGCGWVT